MDDLRTRLDVLEQHTTTLAQHAHRLTRQLRWWRGLACVLLILAGLTWALPVTTAQEDLHRDWRGLPERVAALEQTLRHVTSGTDAEGRAEMVITGANLRVVNGLGQTDCGTGEEPVLDCPNGVGNLIVGYNEPRPEGFENTRTGSHNVVVGTWHNFFRFGGLVVGRFNDISGEFAVVSGGELNEASGHFAVVSGGSGWIFRREDLIIANRATGAYAVVTGGFANRGTGAYAVVTGGGENTASGDTTVVSGGQFNEASGRSAVVSGGNANTASGEVSSVSGGGSNTASGIVATVSGGGNRTAAGDFDWVAGSLFEDE